MNLNSDIQSPSLLKAKGLLFLLLAILAGGMLVWQSPSVRTAVLLAITIWAACRFYYFAFYVLHHYVDSSYRYAGLWSLVRYLGTSGASKGSRIDRLTK